VHLRPEENISRTKVHVYDEHSHCCILMESDHSDVHHNIRCLVAISAFRPGVDSRPVDVCEDVSELYVMIVCL
jgi:hypothetical protein